MATMYGVQRSEKYKRQDIAGIEKEATRTADHYNNDVDTGRSQYNITLIDCGDWQQKINDTITSTGVKVRKDSVLAIGSVYTATGEFFNRQAGETKQEWNNRVLGYFNDCLDWHIKTYCQGNKDLVLSAVIHQDETTLHLQTYSMPIIDRGNDKYALSAKSIMGNKNDYTDRVNSFYNDVSKHYGLSRGEPTPAGQPAKKHIDTQRYKLSKLDQKLSSARAELAVIESDKSIAEFDNLALMQENRKLRNSNQDLKHHNQNLENQIVDLQKQLEMCQFQLNDVDEEIKSAVDELSEAKQELNDYPRNNQWVTNVYNAANELDNAMSDLYGLLTTDEQYKAFDDIFNVLNNMYELYQDYQYNDDDLEL